MNLRIEVKVDGNIIRVEEVELDKDETSKIWNFIYRAKQMLERLNVADLIY